MWKVDKKENRALFPSLWVYYNSTWILSSAVRYLTRLWIMVLYVGKSCAYSNISSCSFWKEVLHIIKILHHESYCIGFWKLGVLDFAWEDEYDQIMWFCKNLLKCQVKVSTEWNECSYHLIQLGEIKGQIYKNTDPSNWNKRTSLSQINDFYFLFNN